MAHNVDNDPNQASSSATATSSAPKSPKSRSPSAGTLSNGRRATQRPSMSIHMPTIDEKVGEVASANLPSQDPSPNGELSRKRSFTSPLVKEIPIVEEIPNEDGKTSPKSEMMTSSDSDELLLESIKTIAHLADELFQDGQKDLVFSKKKLQLLDKNSSSIDPSVEKELFLAALRQIYEVFDACIQARISSIRQDHSNRTLLSIFTKIKESTWGKTALKSTEMDGKFDLIEKSLEEKEGLSAKFFKLEESITSLKTSPAKILGEDLSVIDKMGTGRESLKIAASQNQQRALDTIFSLFGTAIQWRVLSLKRAKEKKTVSIRKILRNLAECPWGRNLLLSMENKKKWDQLNEHYTLLEKVSERFKFSAMACKANPESQSEKDPIVKVLQVMFTNDDEMLKLEMGIPTPEMVLMGYCDFISVEQLFHAVLISLHNMEKLKTDARNVTKNFERSKKIMQFAVEQQIRIVDLCRNWLNNENFNHQLQSDKVATALDAIVDFCEVIQGKKTSASSATENSSNQEWTTKTLIQKLKNLQNLKASIVAKLQLPPPLASFAAKPSKVISTQVVLSKIKELNWDVVNPDHPEFVEAVRSIAQDMMWVTVKLFKETDLVQFCHSSADPDARTKYPGLMRCVDGINKISDFVLKTIIIDCEDLSEAWNMYHFFVCVAKELQTKNDLHTAMAVHSALYNRHISRLLHGEIEFPIGLQIKQKLEMLDDLFSMANNYGKLIEHLKSLSNKFHIPPLIANQRALDKWHAAYPEVFALPRLNGVSKQLKNVIMIKNTYRELPPCTTNLDKIIEKTEFKLSDDELEKKSLFLNPKNSNGKQKKFSSVRSKTPQGK